MLKSLKDFNNNCYCGSLPLIKLHDFPSLISQDSGCLFMFSFGILRGKIGARPAHARRLTAVFNYAVLPHLGAYLKFCSC